MKDIRPKNIIKSRLVKTIDALSFGEPTGQNKNGEGIYKETHSDVSQRISILYKIQDEIPQLKNEILDKDTKMFPLEMSAP